MPLIDPLVTISDLVNVESDALEQVQQSLTLNLIMTPLDQLLTCQRDYTIRFVMERMDRSTGLFSYLPVMDEVNNVLGIYNAERWFDQEPPAQKIGDDFTPYSKNLTIGADSSILDFLTAADKQPVRLLISEDSVAGLVSASDLQKLPVRVALFALITSLEMSMMQLIERECGQDSKDWFKLLNDRRRKKIEEEIQKAKQEDNYVNEILYTQLCDKAEIVRKGQMISGSATVLQKKFRAINSLRDKIMHANNYAESGKSVRKTCETVRNILCIHRDIMRSH